MNIRNFAIIAHIDHGKSTLADRLLETCNAVEKRQMQAQVLDTLEVERERGITVKSQTARLNYDYNGQNFVLNLIDTPGHVDFSFEVRRSLAACEGALILIDASQGIEAQTIANVYRAIENDVKLLPVLNKIDLPNAQVDAVKLQVQEILGISDEPVLISAKTGLGIQDLLKRIIDDIPPPQGSIEEEFQALLIDAWYDPYLGVVMLVRIKNGEIKPHSQFRFSTSKTPYSVDKLGYLTPKFINATKLIAGDVGVIIANIREIASCIMGDTLIQPESKLPPHQNFQKQRAAVFCSLFPPDSSLYQDFKTALEKLALNDASLQIEPTHSPALGVGFRCGFLGLLHIEVVQQRLEQEFDTSVVITAPNVEYEVLTTNGQRLKVHNAIDMPEPNKIEKVFEPWVNITIFAPEEYLGDIINFCLERRAKDQTLNYVNKIGNIKNVTCNYKMPLCEIIFDFHDKLKSLSKGYVSFDYEEYGLEETEVSVVNILVNGTNVDGLSTIIHKDNAQSHGRWVCEKLKDEIPRQLFAIAIQAAIGGKIIARETVSALRKDVTAKCYGGDVSRKRKLLDRQKAGKKKMKEFSIGNVKIPNTALLKVLRRN